MERWRLVVAIGAALAALPLLAIDHVSSAEGREEPAAAKVLGATEQFDLGLDLLASRASSWAVAREVTRQENLDIAMSLAEQARAQEAARLAEAARIATETAMRAEEAKKAEAAKKAAEAARQAAAAAAAAAAKKATPTTAKPAPAVAEPRNGGDPTAAQWAKVRQCESSGNYAAVSAGGRFRGAYQFSQATWDWVAGQVSPELVGVDPAEAAPGHQDNMALNLFRLRGAGQWPVCGAALR